MKDGFGRKIEYLRISLTDKCNLRCSYCMPSEGVRHLRHEDILTFEEITRLVGIMYEGGLRKVRLTGGEPLVRKEAVKLVKSLSEVADDLKIVMTTNGILLNDRAEELKDAGISEINVSLDTLRSATFMSITGTDALSKALSGIEAAIHAGIPVKLNCVPLRGINDEDLIPLAEYAADLGIPLRFIELMPIGFGKAMDGLRLPELIELFEKAFGKSRLIRDSEETVPHGPARYYEFEGYPGKIGIISPLTDRFCDQCNRVRLTSDGILKLCLYHAEGTDLKAAMRSGASDSELKSMIDQALLRKPASHCFEDQGLQGDQRNMYEIGG